MVHNDPTHTGTLDGLIEAVASAMSWGAFSEESIARLTDLMRRFVRFAEVAYCISVATDVTATHVEGFVRARSRDGQTPAVATMHIRRASVRMLFAEGRRLGFVELDPTFGVVLPPRTSLRARPLTDDEVALCRSYSMHTMVETRQPAAWALAEATARSAEIARIRTADVDLAGGRVWIPGASKTDARWGSLSGWGREQIERHIRDLPDDSPEARLVCRFAKAGVSATSSASTAIADTLRRAGLHHEADVRPPSVASWVGATAFAEGASIQEVALMLGIRSLDRTAAFIGFDWHPVDPLGGADPLGDS